MSSERLHRNPVVATVAQFVRRVGDSRLYSRLAGIAGTFGLIAFVVSVIAVFAFVNLADDVLEHELVGVNRDLMVFAGELRGPTATSFAFMFTNLGGVIGVTVM